MKFIRNIVSAGMMVSLVLVLVFTVIDVAVLQDRAFFAAQYEKNQVSQVVQVSSEDLMRITDQLLGYMKGEKEELQLDVTVRGSERPFFSQRELDHMVDVRQMVLGAMWVRRVAVVLVLAFLLFPKNRRTFCKTVVFGLPVFLLLLGVLALVASRDFTTFWWYFHVLFFSNELWILDPAVDLLVNIVPEPFFAACAIRVGIGVVLGIFALWGICFWRYRIQKRV